MTTASELDAMSGGFASQEDFDAFVNDLHARLESCSIPKDATTIQLRALEAELDECYTSLSYYLAYYESKAKKVAEWIKDVKQENPGGGNADERQAKKLELMRNYTIPGTDITVNLLELRDHFQERYDILSWLAKLIDSKHQRIITVSGLLKLEAQVGRV